MKLTKVYIRNLPPGLILESKNSDGEKISSEVDFLDMNSESEADPFADSIIDQYPWTSKHRDHIIRVIKRIIAHVDRSVAKKFILQRVLEAHKLPLTRTAINKEGTSCVTGSYDRTAKVWNLESGNCIATLSGHEGVVFDVAFIGSSEELIATGSFDKDIRIWRRSEMESLRKYTSLKEPGTMLCEGILRKHQGPITALRAFHSPSHGPCLISSSMDHTAIIWDLEMGDGLGSFIGHEDSISDLVTSRNKKFLITASFDGTARIWDTNNFKRINVIQHDYCQVNSLALDWTDKLLVTGTTDSRAMVWDLRNCKRPARTFNRDAEVVHVTFDRTGRKMAASSVDSSCFIVDIATLSLTRSLREHSGEVTMVEFDASGTRVITAGEDGSVILWDIEEGIPLQINRSHKKPIHSLKMSHTGDSFLTAGADSKCCIWRTQ